MEERVTLRTFYNLSKGKTPFMRSIDYVVAKCNRNKPSGFLLLLSPSSIIRCNKKSLSKFLDLSF